MLIRAQGKRKQLRLSARVFHPIDQEISKVRIEESVYWCFNNEEICGTETRDITGATKEIVRKSRFS